MDTPETITHIGLCAGYGGIELGLARVLPNLRSVALCEIEAYACANLVAKMEAKLMDPAPIWTDLKTFPWGAFCDRVDVLTGGYPCQPFSAAGKRLGAEDPRHLWPFIATGIAAMRPRVCFFENVEGHVTLGLREVIGDLERLGYAAAWGIFSAAECGAPHQRKRVFILAHRNDARLEGWISGSVQERAGEWAAGKVCAWPSRPSQPQHAWEPPRVISTPIGNRLHFSTDQQILEEKRINQFQVEQPRNTKQMGTTASGDWQTQPTLGGDADGTSSRLDDAELYSACDNRTDELRLLGNGVVPATAELAFRILFNELETKLQNNL